MRLTHDFTPVSGGASLFGIDEGHQGLSADAETGLVYNRHRYLHVTLGRFTSPDPHPQGRYVDGMNGYEYVRGGPVGAVDPLGFQATTPPNVPMPPRPNLPIPSGYSLTYSGPTVTTQRGPTQKRFMKTIEYQFASKIRPDIAYRDSSDSCRCWRPVIEVGADQDLYELTREVHQYVSWTITGQWSTYTAFATAAGIAGGAGAVGRAAAAGYAAAQNSAATISQTAGAAARGAFSGALFAAAGLIANYNSTFTVTHGPIFWRSWTEVLGTELGDVRRVIRSVEFTEVACTSVAKVFDQGSEAWTRAWSDAFQRALKGAS